MKEAHETLYYLHTPQDEAEADLWLRHYLARYNAQPHRWGRRSRAEDWSANLPEAGIRAMCAWERFCTFAREPERSCRPAPITPSVGLHQELHHGLGDAAQEVAISGFGQQVGRG